MKENTCLNLKCIFYKIPPKMQILTKKEKFLLEYAGE